MTGMLERRDVVRRLLADRGDTLVISGLGSATYDAFAAGDHARNFYLWGAMGGTVPMALGLALAQPRLPVLALTGDGDLLMGLGALATVGQHNPANLAIVVLNNRAFGETGMQRSHTALGTDLVAVARGCAIAAAERVTSLADLARVAPSMHVLGRCTRLYDVMISSNDAPRALPARDGVFLKNRFRAALSLPQL
jgi:thiamine pyrophosphate-dependent acetolactate synthase large subunit-like protein